MNETDKEAIKHLEELTTIKEGILKFCKDYLGCGREIEFMTNGKNGELVTKKKILEMPKEAEALIKRIDEEIEFYTFVKDHKADEIMAQLTSCQGKGLISWNGKNYFEPGTLNLLIINDGFS